MTLEEDLGVMIAELPKLNLFKLKNEPPQILDVWRVEYGVGMDGEKLYAEFFSEAEAERFANERTVTTIYFKLVER